MFPVRLFILTFSFLCIGCSNENQEYSNNAGYYRAFSFPDNKGKDLIDTSLSKKDNKLNAAYCYINKTYDSILQITFFHSLTDGFYNDPANSKIWYGYFSGNKKLYTSSTYSQATGPGEVYLFFTDTAHFEIVLYPYMALPPPKSSEDTGNRVWLDFTEFRKKGKEAKSGSVVIHAADTLNFKQVFFDSVRFKKLFYSDRIK